jgi:hypothetical protein
MLSGTSLAIIKQHAADHDISDHYIGFSKAQTSLAAILASKHAKYVQGRQEDSKMATDSGQATGLKHRIYARKKLADLVPQLQYFLPP